MTKLISIVALLMSLSVANATSPKKPSVLVKYMFSLSPKLAEKYGVKVVEVQVRQKWGRLEVTPYADGTPDLGKPVRFKRLSKDLPKRVKRSVQFNARMLSRARVATVKNPGPYCMLAMAMPAPWYVRAHSRVYVRTGYSRQHKYFMGDLREVFNPPACWKRTSRQLATKKARKRLARIQRKVTRQVHVLLRQAFRKGKIQPLQD